MTLWIVIILGIVEGLTEFLPVSSTGHLILVDYLLGNTGDRAKSFEIAIQLGSILSVMVYFRQRIRQLLTRMLTDPNSQRLLLGLGLAFVPAGVLGLLTHKWIEAHLFGPIPVAWAFIVGGVIILLVEHTLHNLPTTTLEQVSLRQAWWVGIAQCISLFPGTSRSGATIIGGLLAGMDRKTATEYSFLLALPTLLAATGYKIFKSHTELFQGDPLLFPIGLVVAFLTGLAVIAGFLSFIRSHSFKAFAYYRIIVGVLILLFIH